MSKFRIGDIVVAKIPMVYDTKAYPELKETTILPGTVGRISYGTPPMLGVRTEPFHYVVFDGEAPFRRVCAEEDLLPADVVDVLIRQIDE